MHHDDQKCATSWTDWKLGGQRACLRGQPRPGGVDCVPIGQLLLKYVSLAAVQRMYPQSLRVTVGDRMSRLYVEDPPSCTAGASALKIF